MKKVILVMFLIFTTSNMNVDRINLNAGVIKWGVKKVLKGLVKVALNQTKDSIVDYGKNKLLVYLKKNPQYKEYAKKMIIKEVEKRPFLRNKARLLISKINNL